MMDPHYDRSPNYLRVVWSKRLLILLGTASLALIGLVIVMLAAEKYEARALVLIYPPSVKYQADAPAPLADLMPRTLPLGTYVTLAMSRDLLQEVAQTVGVEDVSLERLVEGLRVEAARRSDDSLGLETIQAETMTLVAQLSDPQLAADFASNWARQFKERADRLALGETEGTISMLEAMFLDTKESLESSEEELSDLQKSSNVELISRERTAKEGQVTEFLLELEQTELRIATTDAMLESITGQLQDHERIDTFFRAPPDSAFWIARSAGGSGSGLPDDAGLRTEALNPEYSLLKEKEILERTQLSAQLARRSDLESRIAALHADIDRLLRLETDQRLAHQRLTRQKASYERTYELVVGQREKGKIATLNQQSDVLIAGDAVVPEMPVESHKLLRVLAFAILGCLATIGYVVAEHVLAHDSPDAG